MGRATSPNASRTSTLALRLRPNQQFNRITYLDSGGDSYYHGLQVVLRRRFGRGLGANLTYTLAKSIDNGSLDPVGAASGGGLIRRPRARRSTSATSDSNAVAPTSTGGTSSTSRPCGTCPSAKARSSAATGIRPSTPCSATGH